MDQGRHTGMPLPCFVPDHPMRKATGMGRSLQLLEGLVSLGALWPFGRLRANGKGGPVPTGGSVVLGVTPILAFPRRGLTGVGIPLFQIRNSRDMSS